MKKHLYLSLLILSSLSISPAHAQLRVQRALFSQYQFNGQAINPAFSASDPQGRITAISRHQWIGFDGAPQTQTISGYTTLGNQKTSVGAMLIHDKIGVENEQALFLSLAQKVQISAEGYLSAGFSTGIGYYLGDYASLPDQENTPDPTVFYDQSSWRSNLGLGIMYYDERWEAGLSVPYLVKFNVGASNSTTSLKALRSDYYAMASYRFMASDYIKFKPSLMLKYTAGVPLQFDANMNAYLEEKGLWISLEYRSNAAVVAAFQVRINERMQLGYAHDFMTDIHLKHQMGSHEIMLNYRFKGSKRGYKDDNFRF